MRGGYHTYMVGKWHLGTAAERSPRLAGFESSFGTVEGAAGYKSFMSEGGIVAPLIVAGAAVARRDAISHAYLTAMDIAPTFIALAGASYPGGEGIQPMRGGSLLPLLAGTSDSAHAEDYVTLLAHTGQAMLRQGR